MTYLESLLNEKMNDTQTADSNKTFAQTAGIWGGSVAVAVVVILVWKFIVRWLGGEPLFTSHPVAMGIGMFAFSLSERVLRKGKAASGWRDVAQSAAVGVAVGGVLTLL